MVLRVAINGFGRIGRLVFRAGFEDPDIEFVAVNNRSDTEHTARLLRHDTIHGKFPGSVEFDNENIIVNGKRIKKLSIKNPEDLPWAELNIDVVVESTGVFRTKEQASMHLTAGAKKVLISAPAKGSEFVKTIVKGVNEHEITNEDIILSNASCTTNCFAPIAKVLNDNFKIEKGFMATVHAFTADQKLVDESHSDFRRARSGAMNVIPTTSGAAKAVCEVIPDLKGKLHAEAIRVPVADGSLIYLVATVNKETSKDEINNLLKNVSEHHLKGILKYSDEPLVSSDIISDPHSCIIDSLLTEVNGNLIKIVAWYDNEYGYSSRMIDIIKAMKSMTSP